MAKYTFKDFIPLISIFLIIIAFTTTKQYFYGFSAMQAMQDFMAAFFLVFGFFKVINLAGFAQAYREYDIIAKRSMLYAYAYPFIEIGLGIAYLLRWHPLFTTSVTVILMLISSIGVAQELLKGKTIQCACLGAVFKIPMTYVTLLEDLVMAGMALVMILIHYK